MLLVALAGQQDVAGLHVAVDEAAAVGGIERGGDLADDPDRSRGRERALAGDGVQQVGAVDEAHGDVELAVDLPRLVDGDHVGVVDRGGEHRLALEALAELAVAREVLGDQLQRDGALERDLGRAIHDAHATLAGHAVDLVAREDGACGQLRDAHLYPGNARAGDSFPRNLNVLPTVLCARGGAAQRLRNRTPITAAAISWTISGVAAGASEVWRTMGAALAADGAASATAVVAAAMRRAAWGLSFS